MDKMTKFNEGLQVIKYYDGGLPIKIIASVMDMSLHRVIEIVFWFKVTSRQLKET